MFLALKEIQYSKLRYLLVIGLLFLVSYLVFFLTGLAYGVAESNRSAVDKWDADHIVLADGVSNRITMSQLPLEASDDVTADQKEPIGIQMALFDSPNDEAETISGQLLGIDKEGFLMPNIVEGKTFAEENEVVVDQSLAEENELQLGDKLTFNNYDDELTIVGLTDNAKLSVQPAIYLSLDDYEKLEGTPGSAEQPIINAVVVRGDAEVNESDFDYSAIGDFINDLPGYSAQNLTFGLMIGFLVIISAIVIGIFIYVLTLQKVSTFGVMKAQGISNRYIIYSVVAQTFLLSAVGVLTGLLLTYLTSLVLPPQVPYLNNWAFYGVLTMLMIVVATLGGLFSARTITKIDPLDAIG